MSLLAIVLINYRAVVVFVAVVAAVVCVVFGGVAAVVGGVVFGGVVGVVVFRALGKK